MKRIFGFLTVAVCAGILFAASALAQSSGNIAVDKNQTVCEISSTTGALSCVDPTNGSPTPCPTKSNSVPFLTTNIAVPSGSGNGVVITPSIVAGIFTSTTTSGGNAKNTTTAEAGIMVTVTDNDGPVEPEVCTSDTADAGLTAGVGTCTPAGGAPGSGHFTGVMYDERFQQLTLDHIACSTSTGCSITLILSTLEAHSFNFIDPVSDTKAHTIKVYASLVNTQGTEEACIGPATLTAVQVKAFQQNN